MGPEAAARLTGREAINDRVYIDTSNSFIILLVPFTAQYLYSLLIMSIGQSDMTRIGRVSDKAGRRV